jgi:hypothetical protein
VRQGLQRLVAQPFVSKKRTQSVTDSVLSSNCDLGASAAVREGRSRSIHHRLRQRRFDTQADALLPAWRRTSIRPCLAEDTTTARLRSSYAPQSETGYSQSPCRGIKRCLDSYMVTSSSSCISSRPLHSSTFTTATTALPLIPLLCHSSAPGPPYPDPRSASDSSEHLACAEVKRLLQVAIINLSSHF